MGAVYLDGGVRGRAPRRGAAVRRRRWRTSRRRRASTTSRACRSARRRCSRRRRCTASWARRGPTTTSGSRWRCRWPAASTAARSGESKKEAEQSAAAEALAILEGEAEEPVGDATPTPAELARRDPRGRAGGRAAAARRGFEAHLVGGGVRDMLLGRPPADFDLATDAEPEEVVEMFGHTFAIPTGLKHGR